MQSFKDTEGREYIIRLTIGAVEQIKASTGIDILNVNEADENGVPVIQKLIFDDGILFDVMASMLHKQFIEKNITRDDFMNSVDGEKVKEIADKFFEELRTFFTGRGKRWVAIAIQKDRQAMEEQLEAVAQELSGNK